jgi:hypothetical protein
MAEIESSRRGDGRKTGRVSEPSACSLLPAHENGTEPTTAFQFQFSVQPALQRVTSRAILAEFYRAILERSDK